MGYYLMPLSEEAKKLCMISLPWGLYQYSMLPMGIKPAADIFKQRMGALFFDMPVVVIFMDDTIVFGYADFRSHHVDITNPDKCKWFQPAVTYLGFLITREGIKPQPDKIQGILNMQRPRT